MAIDIKKLNQSQLNELIKLAQSRKEELHSERIAKVRAKVVAFAKSKVSPSRNCSAVTADPRRDARPQ